MPIKADDVTFFVPACGLGTRVQERGEKAFLDINGYSALDLVLGQAPDYVERHVALRKGATYPRTMHGCHVHYFDETSGQAETISRWMLNCRTTWVLISNCDNAIDTETIEDTLKTCDVYDNGVIFTFRPLQDGDARFSYVVHDEDDVTSVVEKNPVSHEACACASVLEGLAWPGPEFLGG